ncbi:pyruvate formate lyase activating enzyme [Lachnospiraceae bacterium PF1-21]|uniref:anaerobic ribonucleoside-triphosphate reductase activating protein n=1 Tax=Ohessyouella blattaphilus TaxID=2949333 RepID=UPI003E22745C
MVIQGLQKTTLLDYPGKVACTVFTSGCNFRCPFCHNASLVIGTHQYKKIPEDEFFAFLKKRQGILDGVCVTGGEPLVHQDIKEFIQKIRQLGFLVKLDTNGSFPKMLSQLLEEKLVDYVAMDIKNSPIKYAETIGVPDYNTAAIEKSIRIIMNSEVDYEFRTTVVQEFHTKADFVEIARLIKGAKAYYLQQYVSSEDMIVSGYHSYDEKIMKQALDIVASEVEVAKLRGL